MESHHRARRREALLCVSCLLAFNTSRRLIVQQSKQPSLLTEGSCLSRQRNPPVVINPESEEQPETGYWQLGVTPASFQFLCSLYWKILPFCCTVPDLAINSVHMY